MNEEIPNVKVNTYDERCDALFWQIMAGDKMSRNLRRYTIEGAGAIKHEHE